MPGMFTSDKSCKVFTDRRIGFLGVLNRIRKTFWESKQLAKALRGKMTFIMMLQINGPRPCFERFGNSVAVWTVSASIHSECLVGNECDRCGIFGFGGVGPDLS